MEPIPLAELVRYAWEYSDFYRKFWSRHSFDPERDFRDDGDLEKIPILTKDELFAVSAKDRSVLRARDCHYFADVSSGTTMRPSVILKSRHAVPPYYRFIHNQVGGPPSSCLILRPGSSVAAFLGAGLLGQYFPLGSIISIGDINSFTFSAHIARETEADWLLSSPSDAVRFAPFLARQGHPPSSITSLYSTAEPLTSAATSLLKRLYPNALILYAYAVTEGPASMGLKSSLCAALDAIAPNAYHLDTHDFIFEVVGGVSVVTALHEMPFPLIRYNIGDRLIIREGFRCSCGFPESAIGIVGPRSNESSYKIGGCTFQVEKIRNALRKLAGLITDDFTLEIEQVATGDHILNLLRFVLRPVGSPTPFLTSTITETLKRAVYVSRSRSLGAAIRQNFVGPIRVDYDPGLEGGRILPPQEIARHFQSPGMDIAEAMQGEAS